MKKTISLILAVAMAFSASPSVYAQNKSMEKPLEKEVKLKMKEYKNGGWKLYGTSRDLREVILEHYDKLAAMGDNGQEIAGVSKYRSDNEEGYQAAIDNACNTIFHKAISSANGASEHYEYNMFLDGDEVTTLLEIDADYEALLKKEIRDIMQESYAIYHDLGDGEKEMVVFFIVNDDDISKVIDRANKAYLK